MKKNYKCEHLKILELHLTGFAGKYKALCISNGGQHTTEITPLSTPSSALIHLPLHEVTNAYDRNIKICLLKQLVGYVTPHHTRAGLNRLQQNILNKCPELANRKIVVFYQTQFFMS